MSYQHVSKINDRRLSSDQEIQRKVSLRLDSSSKGEQFVTEVRLVMKKRKGTNLIKKLCAYLPEVTIVNAYLYHESAQVKLSL